MIIAINTAKRNVSTEMIFFFSKILDIMIATPASNNSWRKLLYMYILHSRLLQTSFQEVGLCLSFALKTMFVRTQNFFFL